MYNIINQLEKLKSDLEKIVERAKAYAILSHTSTNHLYDGQPYFDSHIENVVRYATKFRYLIPGYDWYIVLAALYLHDTIEDCRRTPNDLLAALRGNDYEENDLYLRETTMKIVKIVFAVSNEKGWTRSERANDKYYEGILEVPYADFVKLCDRGGNLEYSKATKSGMSDIYKQEYSKFKKRLAKSKYLAPIWNDLDSILEINKNKISMFDKVKVVGDARNFYVESIDILFSYAGVFPSTMFNVFNINASEEKISIAYSTYNSESILKPD